MKNYNWEPYTCCSGSYIQDVADYHNLIYFRDRDGIFVNLYVPSEVIWNRPEGEVRLVQDTQYPEADTSTLTMSMKRSMNFSLRFRVPEWSPGVSARVNGAAAERCLHSWDLGRFNAHLESWGPGGDPHPASVAHEARRSAASRVGWPSCAARWFWCWSRIITSRLSGCRKETRTSKNGWFPTRPQGPSALNCRAAEG